MLHTAGGGGGRLLVKPRPTLPPPPSETAAGAAAAAAAAAAADAWSRHCKARSRASDHFPARLKAMIACQGHDNDKPMGETWGGG